MLLYSKLNTNPSSTTETMKAVTITPIKRKKIFERFFACLLYLERRHTLRSA